MYSVDFAFMTHPGVIRRKNEDNLICVRDYLPLAHDKTSDPVEGTVAIDAPLLFGVFDGMGGEEHGEAASYLAAKIAAGWKPADEKGLDLLCREINRTICAYVTEHHIRSSGSTASLLLFDPHGVICCHIGDSRIYRYREGIIEQLTKDDVWPSYSGRKAPLLQCLGIPENEMQIRPHIDSYSVSTNDIYVICSDGLSDKIGQDRIAQVLSGDPRITNQIQALMDLALQEDGTA